MKAYLKFTILLCISFEIFSQYSNDSLYKYIYPNLYIPSSCIELINDNSIFEGYLIFEINRTKESEIQQSQNQYYFCDSYWIENLEDLQSISKRKYYNVAWRFYEDEIYINKQNLESDTSLNCVNFRAFYKTFYERSRDSSYHPFLAGLLSTKMFFDSNVVFYSLEESNDTGYYIFINRFEGALLKYSSVIANKQNSKEPMERHFILPTNEQYTFEAFKLNDASNFNLIEANWLPNELTKK